MVTLNIVNDATAMVKRWEVETPNLNFMDAFEILIEKANATYKDEMNEEFRLQIDAMLRDMRFHLNSWADYIKISILCGDYELGSFSFDDVVTDEVEDMDEETAADFASTLRKLADSIDPQKEETQP